MNKILTKRKNKGLFYNSALKTRSYSDGKKVTLSLPGTLPRQGP